MIIHHCAWEYYPKQAGFPAKSCGAVATCFVRYRVDQRVVAYCLNHAQREVLGGQAAWEPPTHQI